MPENQQPTKREQKAAEEAAESGVAPAPSPETAIDPSTVRGGGMDSVRVNDANRAPEGPDPVKSALDASQGLDNPLMDAKGAASTQVIHHVEAEEEAPKSRRSKKSDDDEDKPENANDLKTGQVINGE